VRYLSKRASIIRLLGGLANDANTRTPSSRGIDSRFLDRGPEPDVAWLLEADDPVLWSHPPVYDYGAEDRPGGQS
jgi:hypothetical protein